MPSAPRFIAAGDSISSLVYANSGIAQASRLFFNQIQQRVNVHIANMSSPGQRVSEGGQPGFGLYANRNAIGTIAGYSGAQGLILPLGTNDWDNPGTNIYIFMDQLRETIRYARIDLNMPVILVTPIWRGDHAVSKYHADGGCYTLEQWRYFMANLAMEEAAKPGHFVSVIDGYLAPLMPHDYVDDQIHLLDTGHDKMANFLIQQMQAIGYWL